jgi:transcriptional antiterminator NusG
MSDHGNCRVISWSPAPATNLVNRSPAETGAQWFAVAVKPRYDKAVARMLEAKGVETFVPVYKKRHRYATRFREFELPLFPGYVFCRFNALDRLPILITPGVMQILGTGNTPLPLSETEIASLQTAMRAELPVEPLAFLPVGQKVRISRGILSGVEGIVISDKQCVRLVLSVTLLQRSVLLEIDRDQVSAEAIACQAMSRWAA